MVDNETDMINNENAPVQETDSAPTTVDFGSSFADAVIMLPDAPVQSFAQRRLSNLFESEMTRIEEYTDDHWKTPEFPLARIKKIMRIDEDVKMISGEVPVLLSKAIDLFVTELTLRSWTLTEDSKRRTVQRSDIAMAIAKNDMFDFLIDIVPREEINSRNRSDATLGGQSSQLNPELLQVYLQLLAQQHTESQPPTAGEDSSGKKAPLTDAKTTESQTAMQQTLATNAILQQQIQLIQQIAQLQQQISKTPAISTGNSDTVVDSTVSYMNSSSTDHLSQSFRSVTTNTISTSNSGIQDTLNIVTTPPDLLLPSSLAPAVTPFLSELTASSTQFNPLPSSSSATVSELTGSNTQRYLINPAGFIEHSFHNIPSASSVERPSIPSSLTTTLNNVASGEFRTDIS